MQAECNTHIGELRWRAEGTRVAIRGAQNTKCVLSFFLNENKISYRGKGMNIRVIFID